MIHIRYFILEIFTIKYIQGYFKRNFYYCLTAFIIYAVSVAIGFFNGLLFNNLAQEYVLSLGSYLDLSFLTFMDIFPNNLSIDWTVIVSGIFFSAIGIYITYINGGIIGSYLAADPFVEILFGIAPHGIFEIPSSIIALAGSFMVTVLEIKLMQGFFTNNQTIADVLITYTPLIKDIYATFIYVFVLLFIAGIIESTVTPVLLLNIWI